MIPDVEFSALDLHFAQFMTRLAGRDEDAITLAAALASRATANGDVCVDLRNPCGLRRPQALSERERHRFPALPWAPGCGRFVPHR
jgi:hypothetical protein